MMKKYICYILPVFLLLPILGALGVWSQKNNMQIGLRKTADGEFDVTGDPSAIKNLSYQFMVTDYLNVWQVTGKGDKLQAAYVKSDVLTDPIQWIFRFHRYSMSISSRTPSRIPDLINQTTWRSPI